MTIRVMLVDDHALVRVGLRMILARQGDIEVVGEAASGEQALPAIRTLRPDVVLCDLHLPGISGLDVTERVVRGDYGSRVIVVSVMEDGPLPRRVLEAGAFGYIGKGGDSDELLRAVREVARGKRYLGSNVAQNLALASMQPTRTPFEGLTAREIEVVMLLVRGMRQTEIAHRLNLSPKTVSTHKTRLMDKLQVHDTMALARLAQQYKLVDPAADG